MARRITLFLMTRKGFKVLESLGNNFRDLIDFVVTQADPNVQEDYYEEIQELCKKLNITCYGRQQSYELKSEYAIAISWRWLINSGKTRLIVFHDSLLPKYRGFNPLVSYLINGENKIGVTALFAAEDYDTGEIIAQATSEISYPKKISDAIEIVSSNYVELADQIAEKIAGGEKLVGKPQDEAAATYSLWRDEEDYLVNWTLSAWEIQRFVDAVGFPYKGAATRLNNKLVRIGDVEVVDDIIIENRLPGKVVFTKEFLPIIVCGKGLVKVLSLIDDETGEILLPLRSFRSRFK